MTDHGSIKTASYLINKKIFYGSDVSNIDKKDFKKLKKLNYFVIDCLREESHISHFNLEKVLELVKILKPKKTILTNLHSDLDYNYLLKILPKSIIPAYDGLSINIR